MNLSNLTPQQLNTMLSDLQELVDGDFQYAEEIVAQTGVNIDRAQEILGSINLLKSLTLKQKVSEQKFEKITEIAGVDGVRLVKINKRWRIQGESFNGESFTGEWEYAGDTYKTMDEAYDAAAVIFEF